MSRVRMGGRGVGMGGVEIGRCVGFTLALS